MPLNQEYDHPRENKTLSNEIKDIMDQISEGGRSIHEIDKSIILFSGSIEKYLTILLSLQTPGG